MDEEESGPTVLKNRAWEVLKFLFHESGLIINEEALRELIYVYDEKDQQLLGKRTITQHGKKRRMTPVVEAILFSRNKIAATGGRSEMSAEVLSAHLHRIQQEIEYLEGMIQDDEEAPEECKVWEHTCTIVCVTLRRDKWYLNKEKTVYRGPYLEILYMVFYLQMMYRLWWRRWFILEAKEEDMVPIWGKLTDFANFSEGGGENRYNDDSFPVLQDDEVMAPVKRWCPTKIYRAFNVLMRARLLEGAVQITKHSTEARFQSYYTALLDRLCEIVLLPVQGTPQEIAPFSPEWFRLYQKDAPPDNVSSASSIGATAKRIKIVQDEEMQERKTRADYEGSEMLVVGKPKHVRMKEVEEEMTEEKKLLRLQKELIRKRNQLDLLLNPEAAYDDEIYAKEKAEDEEWIERLKEEIKAGEKTLLEKQDLIRKINEEMHVKLKEKAADIALADYKDRTKSTSISFTRFNYLDQISVLVHHVFCWQYPLTGDKWNPFESHCYNLKDLLKSKIMTQLKDMEEIRFLNNAQKFIIMRDVTFPEREQYRMLNSADAVFQTTDVVASLRTDAEGVVPDLDWGDTKRKRGKVQPPNGKGGGGKKQQKGTASSLPGFPVRDITVFLRPNDNDNPYYEKAWYYFVWWYLSQLFTSQVDVDRIVFFTDLEEECNCLTRIPFQTPAICRLGCDYIVMRGEGEYFKKNALGYDILNGYWCGRDILDALVCWICLMKGHDWTAIDKMTNVAYDISGSPLVEMYNKCNFPEGFVNG